MKKPIAAPRALILTGYGINCDEETQHAFTLAGARTEIVHINDLIDGQKRLADYQILAFPGGFSYGDDTGSGKALANRIRNHLWDDVRAFVEEDKLAIGICNGFQVMVALGLFPGKEGTYGTQEVALVHNDNARYEARWVDLLFSTKGPWTENLNFGLMSLPIAHGEGKFTAAPETLKRLQEEGQVAVKYVEGAFSTSHGLPGNPNGSLDDIAGITDFSGRILGMMPHPERAINFTQLPVFPYLKEAMMRRGETIPERANGRLIFESGVNYFK